MFPWSIIVGLKMSFVDSMYDIWSKQTQKKEEIEFFLPLI